MSREQVRAVEPRKDWCCDWQSGGYESEKKVWGAVTKPSKISKPPISPNLRVFFGKLPLFAVLVGLASLTLETRLLAIQFLTVARWTWPSPGFLLGDRLGVMADCLEGRDKHIVEQVPLLAETALSQQQFPRVGAWAPRPPMH